MIQLFRYLFVVKLEICFQCTILILLEGKCQGDVNSLHVHWHTVGVCLCVHITVGHGGLTVCVILDLFSVSPDKELTLLADPVLLFVKV